MEGRYLLMKLWKKVLIGLCVTLLSVTCLFACLFFWRVSQAAGLIAQDLNSAMNREDSASVQEEDGIFVIYQTLYENLEKYGGLEESMEASTKLADALMERTVKQWTIEKIEWQDDGFLITVNTDGIALQELDAGFVGSVLVKASGDLLANHFLDAASSVFQGEEAMKELLYGSYGPLLFEAAAKKVEEMPSRAETMVLSVHGENGKWNIEVVSEDPAA